MLGQCLYLRRKSVIFILYFILAVFQIICIVKLPFRISEALFRLIQLFLQFILLLFLVLQVARQLVFLGLHFVSQFRLIIFMRTIFLILFFQLPIKLLNLVFQIVFLILSLFILVFGNSQSLFHFIEFRSLNDHFFIYLSQFHFDVLDLFYRLFLSFDFQRFLLVHCIV